MRPETLHLFLVSLEEAVAGFDRSNASVVQRMHFEWGPGGLSSCLREFQAPTNEWLDSWCRSPPSQAFIDDFRRHYPEYSNGVGSAFLGLSRFDALDTLRQAVGHVIEAVLSHGDATNDIKDFGARLAKFVDSDQIETLFLAPVMNLKVEAPVALSDVTLRSFSTQELADLHSTTLHDSSRESAGFVGLLREPKLFALSAVQSRLAEDLDVNATDVVHSEGSGNNGGYHTNPLALEGPPNESSS
ncbi:MAG: hypothetical protein AB7I25_03800 [Vicinamibacterales bacterium]